MKLLFELITDYSLWLALPCLLLGIGYAWLMYSKDKSLSEMSRWLIRLLFVFRSLAVFIIAFLLLNPLIKTIEKELEKPIIVFLQDNTESIVSNKDSLYYKKEYPTAIKEFLNELNDKFELKTYSIGDKLRDTLAFDFSGQSTDLSTAFNEINELYSYRNLGAVILASDGLFNKGLNPIYSADAIKAPVYTLALGDTTVKKDLLINEVRFNKITYLNNQFPIEVTVEGRKAAGSGSTLTISKNNQTLFSKPVSVNGDKYIETITFKTEAREAGLQRYRIALNPIAGEMTTVNNYRDIYIEVIDGRQKILILYNSPHPDVGALRSITEKNSIYQVEAFNISDFNGSLSAYNLIILHQLPSLNNTAANVLKESERLNIPLFFVLGRQSSLKNFNDLKTGLNIVAKGNNAFNDASATVNQNFSLFTLSDYTKRLLPKFPPLNTAFANYFVSPSCNTLLFQKIGFVETQYPLLTFSQNGTIRTGILTGEGLWRWKLMDYAQNGNHNAITELTGKIIQYLSVKIDKSQFRIISKNRFEENEPIYFEAELYNDAYERINTPEVNLEIFNEQGKKFPFVFAKTEDAYRLNVGILPPGDYRYTAITSLGGKTLTQKGQFSVTELTAETSNTVADHQLLYTLAQKHNAKMFYPSEIQKLAEEIKSRDDVKTIAYTTKKFRDLINIEWIFVVITTLLTIEWFIRKRGGSY